jgi:hypothetical protein
VARSLLVAHIDHTNTFVEAPVVNRLNVASAEGEEMRRSMPFERFRDELAAVDLSHKKDEGSPPRGRQGEAALDGSGLGR